MEDVHLDIGLHTDAEDAVGEKESSKQLYKFSFKNI